MLPFLDLPRELRDQIYEAYFHDAEGLFYKYSPEGGTFRYATMEKHHQRLGLRLTSKVVANELQQAILVANQITFAPLLSENDITEFRGVSSRAGRFEVLLNHVRRAKLHMLVQVAPCVSPAILDRVTQRFPSIARWFRNVFRQLRAGHTRQVSALDSLRTAIGADSMTRYQFSVAFCDALQYTLELASTHADFGRLAAQSCTTDLVPGCLPSIFRPGSHEAILSWKPNLWTKPTEADLSLELLLLDAPKHEGWNQPWPPAAVAWHFSATAVAIDFLQGCTPTDRMKIRDIVIQETEKGVGHWECHPRGLLPYIYENQKLRIEIRTGIWDSLVPAVWLDDQHFSSIDDLLADPFLVQFANWAEETTTLAKYNSESITFVLEGQREETIHVWDILKHAAGLQEAMGISKFCGAMNEISLSAIIHPIFRSPVDLQALYPARRIQVPCDLPPSFSRALRDIVLGKGNVRFDGYAGELWDLDELAETRRDWTIHQFWDEWYQLFERTRLPFPPGGTHRYFEIYQLPTAFYL